MQHYLQYSVPCSKVNRLLLVSKLCLIEAKPVWLGDLPSYSGYWIPSFGTAPAAQKCNFDGIWSVDPSHQCLSLTVWYLHDACLVPKMPQNRANWFQSNQTGARRSGINWMHWNISDLQAQSCLQHFPHSSVAGWPAHSHLYHARLRLQDICRVLFGAGCILFVSHE